MKMTITFLAFVLFILASSCKGRSESEALFNGKDLSGWETYIGPGYDTALKKWDTIPVGLNIDPLKVFSVVDLDGEKVIRISGQQFGGMNTLKEFENYHLQMQFKWGKAKWPPRLDGPMDCGLMYHAVGPQGADGGFWMRSHEFQIEEGDCGDYWACAGAIFDVNAKMQQDSSFIYDKNGLPFTFSTVSKFGRNCKKYPDAEKPTGEWNTLDLYCLGSTAVHVMNGVVTMILNNSRQLEGDHEIALTKGKIQIESEGAEIFLKNIRLTPIRKIPDELLK